MSKRRRSPNKRAPEPVDRIVEIERLAALNPIDYEAARVQEAMRLKVRASILDREVTKKRRALGLDTDKDGGQGRAVKIIDPLPYPEPVDGDRLATTLAAAIKTYVVLADAAADAIALWVLHTWTVNAFTMSPRLAVTSPTKGCGKTKSCGSSSTLRGVQSGLEAFHRRRCFVPLNNFSRRCCSMKRKNTSSMVLTCTR